MRKSRTVPLARGLIGGKVSEIYGQMEVFLDNRDNIQIVIRRKLYTGNPDVKFSIPSTDLRDLIDILDETLEQLDATWLSTVAIAEIERKSR